MIFQSNRDSFRGTGIRRRPRWRIQAAGRFKLLTRWAFEHFDQTGSIKTIGQGFLLATILNGYGPLDTALAVWGFFLVQSLYFLTGGVEYRVAAPDGIDPFVKAREDALRLMDDAAT